MKNLYLILLSLFYLSSSGQKPFTSVGTEWHYGISYNHYPSYIQGHYGLISLKDTIIDTDTFSNINNAFFITSSDSFDYYFFRTGFTKKRLFKTNSQIGDTVTLDIYFISQTTNPSNLSDTFIPLRIVIDDIHPISNNAFDTNDSTKVFEFSLIEDDTISVPPPFFLTTAQGSYIDKVGQVDFANFISLFNPPTTLSSTMYLRCFSSSTYNYKRAGFMQPCDLSNVGINELTNIKNIQVKAYPNPANDRLTLSLEDGFISSVNVYTIEGETILSASFTTKVQQQTIDLSIFKRGLYQCIIETDKGRTVIPVSIQN